MIINSLQTLFFCRQGNTVCWSMNAGHWIFNLLFVFLPVRNHKDQTNPNRFSYGLFFPCSHPNAHCIGTSQTLIVQDYLPSSKTVLGLSCTALSQWFPFIFKISFNWEHPCITLIFPLSILPGYWMGVCVECLTSCSFFWGFGCPVTVWQAVCRPPGCPE